MCQIDVAIWCSDTWILRLCDNPMSFKRNQFCIACIAMLLVFFQLCNVQCWVFHTTKKKTAESRRAIVATSTVLHSRWPSLHNLPINRHSQNAISSACETQNTNTTIPIVWMSSRVSYCSLAIAISYHCISHILYIRSIILKAFWHDQCAGHVRNLWLPVGMSNTI